MMVEKIMRTGVLIVVISLAVACLAGKEPVTDRVREPSYRTSSILHRRVV